MKMNLSSPFRLAVVLGLALLAEMAGTPVCAQSNGYTYSRTITITHTKVPNTDQTNFPLLICGTYSYLATTNNGGNVTNTNGYDIIFTSDAAGSNTLAYERQAYNAATGAVAFWIKTPTLSHTTDTVIYMFYGNSSVTTDQSNHTAVWDSNYLGVWHMSNGVTLNANDSTSNANNGSVSGVTAVTGVIADAASYGSSGEATTPQQAQSGQLTYEIWAYATGGGGSNFGRMFDTSSSTGGEDLLSYNAGAGTYQYQYTLSTTNGVYGITAPSLNAWHSVAVTYNTATPSVAAKMYLDGAAKSLASSQAGSGNPVTSHAGKYVIGNRNDLARNWGGYLEEFRLSKTIRSADWIATEYNNQSSPATFYTIGSQNGGGGGSPSISTVHDMNGSTITSGTVGEAVFIYGGGFGASQGNSTVTFNGTAATVFQWTANQINTAVPSGATSGNLVVTVGGVASNAYSFTVLSGPNILSVHNMNGTPISSGTTGELAFIYGGGFGASQGNSTVTFNGTPATVFQWTAGQINTAVPDGATSGNLVVTVGGAASNAYSFTVSPGSNILSIHDSYGNVITSGTVGEAVFIYGGGFGASQGNSTVTFGATPATVSQWTENQINTAVPSGATTGNVVVTVGGVASNGYGFTVTGPSPSITSLSPSSGPVGTSVTITGTNFGGSQGTSTVTFSGTAATPTSWSATSIVAPVPSGATTGNVLVAVSGVASNGVSFTITGPSSNVYYYIDDMLGSSRTMVQDGQTSACYEADFYPFGGERDINVSCVQNYKFEGKERDGETQNDNFGARYYSNRFGRWLSADWSSVPTPVPYANLTNPQTLNLYAMVSDNPETFADLDGHLDCSGGNNAHGAGCQYLAEWNAEHEITQQQTAQQQAQQQTAQSVAAQVPGEVKTAIMASVNASNAPTADDKKGGFHEEGGVAGTTPAGVLVVSPDKPGPYSNPDTSNHASTTHTPVNQDQRNSIANITVMWHVHPSGRTATHSWVQPPSAQDRSVVVPGPINIVVGAGNKTVYFYDGGNMNLNMSLNQFMGIQ